MPEFSLRPELVAPWSQDLGERLSVLRRFRHLITSQRDDILTLLGEIRTASSRGELVSSEVVPLLDACRFLEKRAESILQPQVLGRKGQPPWLWGVESTIYQEPLGRILMLCPGNYPLFLPVVQALQAWAAGNAVWFKSAPGCLELHSRVRDLFLAAGGPEEAFLLLGEENSAFGQNLGQVQKVVLVGSANTGRTVLAEAAQELVPVVAELSGWDVVFVHPEACQKKAAQAVAFGLALNGGQTCVAPRRVFVIGDSSEFEVHFAEAIRQRPSHPLSESELEAIRGAGDTRLSSARENCGPALLCGVSKSCRLLREEAFGALSVLIEVESTAEALELARQCPYALGASLFGPEDWAQGLAHQVPAQMVSVNDVIVPTADPRVPFGGSGSSGFGRMRGGEGLLEMTQTRTVSYRRGGGLDHLLAPGPLDDLIVEKFLLMSHSGTAVAKLKALVQMITAIAKERIRKRRLKIERPSS